MYRKRTAGERFWEILPGLQFWIVFFGSILLSYYRPVWSALFIICFDLYWVLKAINVAAHLIVAYQKFKVVVRVDWLDYIQKLSDMDALAANLAARAGIKTESWTARNFFASEAVRLKKLAAGGKRAAQFRDYYHLILIPFIDESFEVLDSTLQALAQSRYPKDRILILLASEERAG
ncbi:MAG TPA: hypothetical protein VHA30_03205, partial [Patescibacteria group bacterium]|nr:hypothetical protein [Patescibacteria group bacterium]